jgi:hypothetical protein
MADLEFHHAPGYHVWHGGITEGAIVAWFSAEGWRPPQSYIRFLSEVGWGSFFGGSLILFPPEDPGGNSVRGWSNEIAKACDEKYVAIGYDGTTSGCFCVSGNGDDSRVYWYEWAEEAARIENEDFFSWIESLPSELFVEGSYRGFKEVRDPQGVQRIIEWRRCFSIRISKVENEKVRPPGHEDDLLPRYHKVIVEVTKLRDVGLQVLTIPFLREGSKIGKSNVAYATINVSHLPVGEAVKTDVFLFDPFNIPFDCIQSLFRPEIDLNSRMKAKFVELQPFL